MLLALVSTVHMAVNATNAAANASRSSQSKYPVIQGFSEREDSPLEDCISAEYRDPAWHDHAFHYNIKNYCIIKLQVKGN